MWSRRGPQPPPKLQQHLPTPRIWLTSTTAGTMPSHTDYHNKHNQFTNPKANNGARKAWPRYLICSYGARQPSTRLYRQMHKTGQTKQRKSQTLTDYIQIHESKKFLHEEPEEPEGHFIPCQQCCARPDKNHRWTTKADDGTIHESATGIGELGIQSSRPPINMDNQ